MIDLTCPHSRAEIARQLKKQYDAASLRLYEEDARNYLGASEIGRECRRDLWYAFRWFRRASFDGRMLRLFQRGHREEPIVFEHYRNMGFLVNSVDPVTNKQYRFSGIHGHFGGGCDGRGYFPDDFPYRQEIGFEVKTANDNQFKKFVKDGVRKWKPVYAGQMDVYGRAWEIKYFVFIVVNKNTDEVEFEIYECDYANADALLAKGFDIVGSRRPPAKLSNSPNFSACRDCFSNAVCHLQRMPPTNCRTCHQSVPWHNGEWYCEGYGAIIPSDVIKVGCNAWKPIDAT